MFLFSPQSAANYPVTKLCHGNDFLIPDNYVKSLITAVRQPHEPTRERLIGSLIDWLFFRHFKLLHLAVVELNVNLSPLAPHPLLFIYFVWVFFLHSLFFCHREKQSASEEQGQQ